MKCELEHTPKLVLFVHVITAAPFTVHGITEGPWVSFFWLFSVLLAVHVHIISRSFLS